MPSKSSARSSDSETSGGPPGSVRKYLKYAVAILAAFGIFGAVGSLAVNKIYSSADEALNPEKSALISVTDDPQCGDCSFATATRSPEALGPKVAGVKGCGSLFAAMKSAGAVDVGAALEGATVERGTRRDVTIVGMHARILKREPALHGALAYCAPAGEESAIGVLFNLDADSPVALKRAHAGDLSYGTPYFATGSVVELTRGETQPFMLIGVTTSRDYVEWEVVADVVIDGHKHTITINDNGQPFRVTGVPRGFRAKSGTGYNRYVEWQYYNKPARLWDSKRPSGPYCPIPAPYNDCKPPSGPNATGAGQASAQIAAQPRRQIVRFSTPSRNIACEMRQTGAVCMMRSPPASAKLTADNRVSICQHQSQKCTRNLGHAPGPPRFHQLPYGSSATIGQFHCSSAFTGVTCIVTATRKGFFISRQSVKAVG